MNIAHIIAADRVGLLRGINSKKRALEEISRLLASGTTSLPESEILASLVNREKLGSTGLGEGVAIPHGRVRGIDKSIGAFIRVEGGVDYEAVDGRPVDLIFGLLVPQDCTEEHLGTLAGLAEMFLDENFCSAMRSTQDPQALLNMLVQYTPAAAA
jgi:PTS system nitrogen regulatory IIA component